MTNVIKCNTCNIIIDEMLSYIQNKVSVIDEQTLVRICTTSFTSEEIENSKMLLFESVAVDKHKIKRKNQGKEERNLGDIINLFKSTDPEQFPIYVAKELDRLPPLVYDHFDCSKILKDLQKIQVDLNNIKSTYVTKSELRELETELNSKKNYSVCNVNMRRGTWTRDRGPQGKSHTHNSPLNIRQDSIPCGNYKSSSPEYETNLRVDMNNSHPVSEVLSATIKPIEEIVRTVEIPIISTGTQFIETQPTTSTSSAINNTVSPSKFCEQSQNHNDKGWQVVHYKRRKPVNYRYLGKSGISQDEEGKFRAADSKAAIFITKIHKDTKEKDITDYD